MQISFKTAIKTCLILLFTEQYLIAQFSNPKYEIGLNTGAYIYQGDLTPAAYGSFKTPSFAFGMHGSRRLSNILDVRVDIIVGKLKGDESKYATPAWRKQRAFAFQSRVAEIFTSVQVNPLGKTRKWSPFLFGGTGYSLLNITRDFSNYNSEYFSSEDLDDRLATDIERGMPSAVLILPVGIVVRYRITDKLSIVSETSCRFMFTDYIDGFSHSGNPQKKDHYYKYSISLVYSFPGKNIYDCPVVRRQKLKNAKDHSLIDRF